MSICSNNHTYENCNNKQNVKCCNCGQSHSAGYKGCEEFLKAKKIKEFSHNNRISYAEATKQIKTNTTVTVQRLHRKQPKIVRKLIMNLKKT